jgi:hypothetical protein
MTVRSKIVRCTVLFGRFLEVGKITEDRGDLKIPKLSATNEKPEDKITTSVSADDLRVLKVTPRLIATRASGIVSL